MIKKQIILPSKRFYKSPQEDSTVRINLDKSENLLRENEKNIVIDIAQLYDKERNDSIKYKIYGKIKMIFRNLYSGFTDYTYLKDRLYLASDGDGTDPLFIGNIPYDEFAFLRTDVLREVNKPTSGTSVTNFVEDIVISGSTGHTIVTAMSAPYQNWNVYLSYVYSASTTIPISYSLSGNTYINFTSGDGIPFRGSVTDEYYVLTSPVQHGMSVGEYITISGGTFVGNPSGRTFYIDDVGNEIYRSEKYVVNISKTQFPSGFTFPDLVVCKRCLDISDISGTTSQYYVHIHKTLTNVDEYIMDRVGYESPIWEDETKVLFENFSGVNDYVAEANRMESVFYDFKTTFNLSGITNNMGYTPTEVYTSVIFRNGNGYFNYPPKVGWTFNIHNSYSDQHFYGSTSEETSLTSVSFNSNTNLPGYTGFTFLSGATLPTGSTLFGAFVEYNEVEFSERIISESIHKITHPVAIFDHSQTNPNFYSGVSIDNPVGYFYQPHYKIKLRELSPYIETYNTNDVYNLPENVKYDDRTKLWKWRDLYEHGYVDVDGYGTDFPFVNGTHYVKKDINFYIRNEREYQNKTDGISKFTNLDC